MDRLFQDVRYAVRTLLKNRSFTIVAAMTVALVIGANTAIFSVVDAVLLRPLPFPEPDRLVSVAGSARTVSSGSADAAVVTSASYPDFFDWRAQARSLAALASYRDSSLTLTGAGDAQHVPAEIVAAGFFDVLGVQPALGRGFEPDDERPGSRVVVLSHGLWRTRFGADPSIVGRALTLGTLPYTVVGIAPAGFTFPLGDVPLVWTTLAIDAQANAPGDTPMTAQRGAHFLNVVGRLKSRVTVAQAAAEMNVIAGKLAQQYPDTNKNRSTLAVRSKLEELVGPTRPALLVLLAAVGCVLLIGCANVANLLSARGTNRRREIAVRAALGAGRGRVVRQLLTESIMLSLIGGASGLALTVWSMPLLLRLAPQGVPRIADAGVDVRVLVFTVILSVVTGMVFGLMPALQATRTNLVDTLKEADRGGSSRGHRARSVLVVAETALGLMLLVCAGLLLRTFAHLTRTDPGFDPHHVLTLRFDLPAARYSTEQQVRFYDELLDRLNHVSGIQAAATTWILPLSDSEATVSFEIEGRPMARADRPAAALQIISPRYFETLHIPALRGRAFDAHDTREAKPVVIVSQAFARKYFSNEDPVGRKIRPGISDSNAPEPWREIVGVVADIKQRNLSGRPTVEFYAPYTQAMVSAFPLCIRTVAEPQAIVGAVRRQIDSMDRQVAVYAVRTLDEYRTRSVQPQRFTSFLLAVFAGFALLLTMVGLYGVMAYSVAQQTHDIGIRIALGASRTKVLRMVLRRGLVLAAVGIAVGTVLAGIAARSIDSLLYGVRPLDASTYLAVTTLLAGVALVASYVPARRATAVDPMIALRYE